MCSEQMEHKSKWHVNLFLTGSTGNQIFGHFRPFKSDLSKDMDEKEATDEHDATVEEEEKVKFFFLFFPFIPKF